MHPNARPRRLTSGGGSTDHGPLATIGHTGRSVTPRSTRWPSAPEAFVHTKAPKSTVSRTMKSTTRRSFLRGSMTAGLALGVPRLMLGAGTRWGSPNNAVNVAVIGLGSTTAVGGVGGRGHQLIG